MSTKKIELFIASDHAGFELKQQLIQELQKNNSQIQSDTHLNTFNLFIHDLGPNSTISVDYPDYADKVSLALQPQTDQQVKALPQEQKNESIKLGLLICGSGQGMSLRANKYSFIRAALIYSSEIAVLAREHNDANIFCFGSRFCTLEQALAWTKILLTTEFAGGRHQTRVDKVSS